MIFHKFDKSSSRNCSTTASPKSNKNSSPVSTTTPTNSSLLLSVSKSLRNLIMSLQSMASWPRPNSKNTGPSSSPRLWDLLKTSQKSLARSSAQQGSCLILTPKLLLEKIKNSIWLKCSKANNTNRLSQLLYCIGRHKINSTQTSSTKSVICTQIQLLSLRQNSAKKSAATLLWFGTRPTTTAQTRTQVIAHSSSPWHIITNSLLSLTIKRPFSSTPPQVQHSGQGQATFTLRTVQTR
jgi:hypothetical protein